MSLSLCLSEKEIKFMNYEQTHNMSFIVRNPLYKIIKNIYCYGIKRTLLKIKNRCH